MHKAYEADHIIPALLLAVGLLAILFSIFAHALGFDPTPDWGRSRIVISILGTLFIICASYLFRYNPQQIQSERIITFAAISHAWAVIILIYVWFITFGTFTEWRASTRYYSLLADAFNKGQLHVDVEPGAALLDADDPYNNEGRPPFDDDVWDLSLYKGKLYLYWGPVPALLMAPLQRALGTSLPDLYPVFFFFDLAAEQGGNCALTKQGERVVVNGVSVIGEKNLPSQLAAHASLSWSRNVEKLLMYLTGGAGDVLAPTTRAAMLAPQGVHFWSTDHTVYGLSGWDVPDIDDTELYTNSLGFGFQSATLVYPTRGLAIIALLNSTYANATILARDLGRVFDPSHEEIPGDEFDADPALAPEYSGTFIDPIGYLDSGPRTLTVTLEPDQLTGFSTALDSDGDSLPLTLEPFIGQDNFLATELELPVRFWRDETGAVYAVSFDRSSGPPFYRVP